MRTIEQTVYEFSELSDRAKETAREWWRRDQDFDLEHTIDDAATVARYPQEDCPHDEREDPSGTRRFVVWVLVTRRWCIV